MIIHAILYCYVLLITSAVGVDKEKKDTKNSLKRARCLTGHMTDLQSWVDEFGQFTANVDNHISIDVSTKNNVGRRLEQELHTFKSSRRQQITYLSIANCNLLRVPSVFKLQDNMGRRLADTVEFMTFYGNNFGAPDQNGVMYDVTFNATNAFEMPVAAQNQRRRLTTWSFGLNMPFSRLKELDLRACSIQAIGDNSFQRMFKLEKLYLSDNNILYIETRAFASMQSLRHLDLSRNYAYDTSNVLEDLIFESLNVFSDLNLESIDFSYTRFGQRNINLLRSLGKNMKRLSLCYSGLGKLRDDAFYGTSIKYLDLSGNTEVIYSKNVLRGIEDHLEVLYADSISMSNMEGFMNFSHLEILKLSNNEISKVPQDVARNLVNLKILDLDNNRLSSWFNDTFKLMSNLKFLSLKNNNINVISRQMYEDIEKLSYLSLSGNFLVCNCHARDLFEVALNNELYFNNTYIDTTNSHNNDFISFHTGFKDFNNIIRGRSNITRFCELREGCFVEYNYDVNGNYLLLDYDEFTNQYQCLMATEGKTIGFYNVSSCTPSNRELSYDEETIYSWNKYFLLVIPTMILPLLLCVYLFRKNFKYFLITIRNSATLSLINKNDASDDSTIFNYDVFVSYCNEDRAWVLDNLLSHVEKDCNISVCLHERDFQIGLSILENIVSCMDRSRMIMLIISKRFLLSQWCQFEMHLAQHRLLETRREDLILVLLEEIPRCLRPNTLHYLMLTKTYIVWPKDVSEQKLFWRRMKKSLVTHKLKHAENVSLA